MTSSSPERVVTTFEQSITRTHFEDLLSTPMTRHRFERCAFDGEDIGSLEMQGVEFVSCSFVRTHLDRASLDNTIWSRCLCAGATFDLADISDARFDHCDLNNTNWCRSKLSGASFVEVKLTGARFTEARTLGMTLRASLLVSADLRGVSFRKQTLEGLNFSGADLSGCDFTDAVLDDCDISDASLKNAKFARADLRRARLGAVHVADLLQHFKGSKISAEQAAELVAAIGVNVV